MDTDFNSRILNDEMYVQAAEWIELLDSRPLDAVTRKRLQNWLAADPAHRELLRRMIVSWADPALLQTLKRYEKRKRFFQLRPWLSHANLLRVSFVFLLTVTAVVGFRFYDRSAVDQGQVPQVYASEFETKHHELTDGSTITQSAASELVVDITEKARNVLLNAGAAFFDITVDEQRPFQVQVQASSFTAVGTLFSIDKTSHSVELTVYEGAVEMRAKPQAEPKLLRSGEKIQIVDGIVQAIEQVDILKIVDWRSGWIEMKGEPLGYLLEHLNRYSRLKAKVMQRELNDLPVAGRFKLTDMTATLEAVSHFYSLRAQKNGDQYLLSNGQRGQEFTTAN